MKYSNIITILLSISLGMLSIGSSLASNILTTEFENPPNIEIQTYPITDKIESILQLVTEDTLREHLINILAVSPRYTGTEGCEKAAQYIYEQFDSSGLQTRFQDWTSFGNRYHPKIFSSQNVEGIHPGTNTDKIVIFNAHYDTVQNTPGANDDGSGTVAVITAAYVLSQFSFNHTLRFVTFSGEELGLRGSEAYAEECYKKDDDILFDINADMIGRATAAETGRKMGLSLTEDAFWVADLFESISSTFDLHFSFNRYDIDRDGRGYSDYFPFTTYGWEAVACWQGEGDPNMHQETDTIDNVNFSYLVNTTKLIVGTLAYLADSDEIYPQLKITLPKRQSIYNNGLKVRNQENLKTLIIDDFNVKASSHHLEKYPLERVEFYLDDILYYTDTTKPFSWHCNVLSFGEHRITAISYDHIGQKTIDYQDIFYINLNPYK